MLKSIISFRLGGGGVLSTCTTSSLYIGPGFHVLSAFSSSVCSSDVHFLLFNLYSKTIHHHRCVFNTTVKSPITFHQGSFLSCKSVRIMYQLYPTAVLDFLNKCWGDLQNTRPQVIAGVAR